MAFALIAATRIAGTYGALSPTFDETVHLTSGIELLSRHRYTYALEHTPMARIFAAIGPLAAGTRFREVEGYVAQANAVMDSGPGFARNLELGRWGVLPFFLLTCLFLYLWGRRLGGDPLAASAVGLFSLTPPVLAHSGLVTTDSAAMASFVALLLAFEWWLDAPSSRRRTVVFGVAGGCAVACKLSAIPFFGATALVLVALRRFRSAPEEGEVIVRRPPLKEAGIAVLVGLLVLYATYGFTVGRALGFPAPLSEFVFGLMLLLRHGIEGNPSYLLGDAYSGGRWYFFPVALAVKTPISLLALAAVGGWVALRRWLQRDKSSWMPALAAFAVPFLIACASNINLGTRHILPVFPALALLGAMGIVVLWERSPRLRWLPLALVTWMAIGTWRVHPDYLAYFNEIAAGDPGAYLVESDLDWGQDLYRLADTVRTRRISDLSLAYYGFGDLPQRIVPGVRVLSPGDPRPTGWVAVSETRLRRGWASFSNGTYELAPDAFRWLEGHQPVAQVGRSIRLYSIPGTADSRSLGPAAGDVGNPAAQ